MKINAVVAICKKEKRIILFEGKDRVQWLSDGFATYPLFKMPYLTEQNLFTMFDIPENKQKSFHFKSEPLPENLCFDDIDDSEIIVERGKISITTAGRTLTPIHTSLGMLFIDCKYLAPLADIFDTLELYERISNDRKMYIAIKSGLMLMGVVMPFDLVNNVFVENMERLTQQCKVALFNKKEEEKNASFGFQCEMPV